MSLTCSRLKSETRINPQMTEFNTCVGGVGGCGVVIYDSASKPAYYAMDLKKDTFWRSENIPNLPIYIGWKSSDENRTYTLDTLKITNNTLSESPTNITIQGGRGELDNIVWVNIATRDINFTKDNEEIELDINSKVAFHSYRILINDAVGTSKTTAICDLGFFGKVKYCLEKESFELIANSHFDCGVKGWEFEGATLTDEADSTVLFKSFTASAELYPQESISFNSSDIYLTVCEINSFSGLGALQVIQNDDNVVESIFLPNIVEYQMFVDNVRDIKIASKNDEAFEAKIDKFSSQMVRLDDMIVENNDVVSFDGEVLICEV